MDQFSIKPDLMQNLGIKNIMHIYETTNQL